MDLTRPLWVDPDTQSCPTLDKNLNVDVAVIGGGFSGLGAAYALRDANLRVALIEGRTLASGASGRNAGFVLAGPAMPYDDAVRNLGRETAHGLWSFTLENNRTIADLVEDFGIDCGYLRRGSMSLAATAAEWSKFGGIRTALDLDGIETCLVRRSDLPRPFDRLYCGGLYYPGNAELNPASFLRSLARELASSIKLFERTRVTGMTRRGSEWQLATPSATLSATSVLLATNAYTPRLLPSLPIVPRRGQVLSTSPIARVVSPFPMYANHGYQYWRQTADGHFVVGGWRDLDPEIEIGEEEIVHARIHAELDRFLEQVVGVSAVEHRWCGIMGFTPDLLPLAGTVPEEDNLFIAAGYSGHGVAMAFKCGQEAAKMAVGEKAGLPSAFDPARFTRVAPRATRVPS